MNQRLVAPFICVIVLSLAFSLSGARDALAADSLIASTPRATAIEAFKGRVLWSEWHAARSAYQLVELAGEGGRALPVAPKATPFDVDMGPDSSGRPIAVYSRCRLEQASVGQRGCDLYRYSFTSGRETKLPGTSSGADERLPAVWRDRISFARTFPARGRQSARHVLYWRSLSSRRPSRRLRSGRSRFRPVPIDLDLRGRRVAVVWSGDFSGQDIRLSTIGGRPRRISLIPGSGAAAVIYRSFGISIAGEAVYWMVAEAGELNIAELSRHPIRGGFDERALVALDESTISFAHDGETGYYIRPAAGEFCTPCPGAHEIRRVEGLGFERAPRLEFR